MRVRDLFEESADTFPFIWLQGDDQADHMLKTRMNYFLMSDDTYQLTAVSTQQEFVSSGQKVFWLLRRFSNPKRVRMEEDDDSRLIHAKIPASEVPDAVMAYKELMNELGLIGKGGRYWRWDLSVAVPEDDDD